MHFLFFFLLLFLFLFFKILTSIFDKFFKLFIFHCIIISLNKFYKLYTFTWIFLKHWFNCIFALIRYWVCFWKFNLFIFDHLYKFSLIGIIKRQGPVKHCIIHNTYCPYIDSRTCVCCLFFQSLWSHVGKSTSIDFVLSHHPCYSKVYNFHHEVIFILCSK